jgi:Domain of unknown function (DUF4397)
MGRPTLRSIGVAVVGVGLFALLSAWLTPSSAADQTWIYIVQGLPNRTISVTVDGDSVVGELADGTVAGPFPVKHGTRTVTVSEDGKTLVTSKVKLLAGSNSELVVHLPASPPGDPMITRFDNNLKPVQEGKAAHAFGHVAAAGPIDIRVDNKVVFANIANGEYLYKVVPAGTYQVDIVPTEMSKPLLGPLKQRVRPDKLTWVFVIGEPGKNLAIVRHVISLSGTKGSRRPTDISTGTGGQAAELIKRHGSRP